MRIGLAALPMRIIDRYTGPGDKNSIEYWQRFIFHVMAFSSAFLGTLCLVPSVVVVFLKGQTLACAFIIAVYAVNIAVILIKRIPVKAKTLVISLNFYLFGLASLVLAGPEGESGIWFSVCVLLCSLFVGFRVATLFACLDFLTGLAFGLLHARGLIGWEVLRGFRFSSWLLQSANIFFVDMMFAIANALLIRGVGATFGTLNAAEARISASLTEKETLIRELYHRSNNNMQVVSSLLMLHMKELDGDAPKAVFKDVLDRIAAMSLVHQKLYESRDLSNVDMAEYVRDLVDLVKRGYGLERGKIEVELELEPITLLIDTAMPCALVIDEIVTNSLKHAFPRDRPGRIRIGLAGAGEDRVELTISDDGVGLPEGFTVEAGAKAGMRTLFNLVTRQLQGSIEYLSSGGLSYTVRFARKLYDERVKSNG